MDIYEYSPASTVVLFDGSKTGQRTEILGVVLPGVGRYISQDGHLVDRWIIFGVHALEFRMKSFVACAGQAGIAFGDLEEGSPSWKLV